MLWASVVFLMSAFSVPIVPVLGGLGVPTIESFAGGLLGVSARVDLDVASKRAHIRLSGLPLGGTLEGDAEFSDGEGSQVVIHEPLRGSLRRRFVRISSAEFNRKTDTVSVVVKLPLLLGTQRIVLYRKI